MKFEFEKYQSQVLISLRFLSKNKDNELSAEKSKSYKYLMDKSIAKELVNDIKIYNWFLISFLVYITQKIPSATVVIVQVTGKQRYKKDAVCRLGIVNTVFTQIILKRHAPISEQIIVVSE